MDGPEGATDPLALLLLQRSRWFDRGLRAALAARGWPHLTAAQSMLFANLDAGGTAQVVLAERLGVTRQSAHELVAELARLDLVAVSTDPTDRRRRVVALTPAGREQARDATEILAGLRDELGRRIGRRRVEQLHAALSVDWGTPPDLEPTETNP